MPPKSKGTAGKRAAAASSSSSSSSTKKAKAPPSAKATPDKKQQASITSFLGGSGEKKKGPGHGQQKPQQTPITAFFGGGDKKLPASRAKSEKEEEEAARAAAAPTTVVLDSSGCARRVEVEVRCWRRDSELPFTNSIHDRTDDKEDGEGQARRGDGNGATVPQIDLTMLDSPVKSAKADVAELIGSSEDEEEGEAGAAVAVERAMEELPSMEAAGTLGLKSVVCGSYQFC